MPRERLRHRKTVQIMRKAVRMDQIINSDFKVWSSDRTQNPLGSLLNYIFLGHYLDQLIPTLGWDTVITHFTISSDASWAHLYFGIIVVEVHWYQFHGRGM
jgi:hypothetical protein